MASGGLYFYYLPNMFGIVQYSLQGSTPTLTNFINHPLYFLTAFRSDVMSQLNSRERGGASDWKNPEPYYTAFKNSQLWSPGIDDGTTNNGAIGFSFDHPCKD